MRVKASRARPQLDNMLPGGGEGEREDSAGAGVGKDHQEQEEPDGGQVQQDLLSHILCSR